VIMSNSNDTEFGEYVFQNDLTTFEALSKLDVTSVGREVADLQRELAQTRSELSDQAVALDNLTARVNTDSFRITDLEVEVQALATGVSDVTSQIETLNDRVEQVSSNVLTLEQTVETLTSQFSNLSIRVDDVSQRADQAIADAAQASSQAGTANTTASNALAIANTAEQTAQGAAAQAQTAQNTAQAAQVTATTVQSQLNALTTPESGRIPILLGADSSRLIVVSYPDTQTWTYGVRLDVPSGTLAQVSQVYSGQVAAYNENGTWITAGSRLGNFARITFISQENFNPASQPYPAGGAGYIRPGVYLLRYGTVSTYNVTITVRIVDIIVSPL